MAKPNGDLSGEDRDAYAALVDMFNQYGLGTLAPLILQYLQDDYSPATITIELQNTDEYKTRFAGNEDIKRRIAAGESGLKVLSPAEYLAQEKQYRDVLSYYGLPPGFYDDPQDFAGWIGQGVSVLEVQDRARDARQIANDSPPEVRDALRQYYGITEGDIAAYFLDQKRTLPILERRVAAANLGGAAGIQHLGLSRDRAEELAGYGVTADQANQGFAAIADILPDAEKLASIDRVEYDQSDAEDEVFKGSAAAAKKRRDLAKNEKARFGASSASGSFSFAQDRGDY